MAVKVIIITVVKLLIFSRDNIFLGGIAIYNDDDYDDDLDDLM